MKKYWALIHLVILDKLEYPAEVFYWLTLNLIPLGVMVYVWLVVFHNHSRIAGYDLHSIVTYYFLVFLIGRLTAHTANWIAQGVINGELSIFLVKPTDFMTYIFFQSLSARVINLLISAPMIIVVFFLVKDNLLFPSSLQVFLLFLASTFLGLGIFYFLGFTLGLIALWTLEIGSLLYFYTGLLEFLGGGLLPISFFPQWFQTVLSFLPFKYVFYFPISIYLHKLTTNEILLGFLTSSFWLAALYIINRFIWKQGINQYTGFGG